MYQIKMPSGAAEILSRLQQNGYEAYLVGGCVRDCLLGKQPKDWDICTAARPKKVLEIFSDQTVIKTGLKHGTVSVLLQDGQYELTTFRVDGPYSDSRHPDQVSFVSSLREDLARRDFTFNALAYSDQTGIVDYFGGVTDLKAGLIRCVGRAQDRFTEDALRIIRGLRFAATFCCRVEPQTADAMRHCADGLCKIAAERIFPELCKLLCGADSARVLLEYSAVFTQIIPELGPCVGFDQKSRYHCFTVYEHIVRSVAADNGQDPVVKLALLLHDIGKPRCYSEDERGGHFRGHAGVSCEMSRGILARLKCSNQIRDDVLELIQYHDMMLDGSKRQMRRWLNRLGVHQMERLLAVQTADTLAHTPQVLVPRLEKIAAQKQALDEVIAEHSCFSLKDMKINGNDLLRMGVPMGKTIGRILRDLLEQVMDGSLENNRDCLLDAARTWLRTEHIAEKKQEIGCETPGNML